MNDSFSALARKIRSKKLNKEDIENLKKEAIESKIERNRRQKKAIEIQRIIRGYLARKKFKILEEKVNINTIIEYLYEKKLKRIHKHSSQIISYFLYKYIERQRKIKNKLINEFKIHCSDLIKAFIRGIIVRKNIKDKLDLIRTNKKKLEPYILSYRTRLMLKCKSIQNILVDIANIKFLLQDEKDQTQNEEGKQGIKELKLKLRKKYNEFYLIYYQNKMTTEWVDEERTPEPWLKRYQKILNGEDVSYIKKNTNNIDNKNYNNINNKKDKSQRKMKNIDNKIDNNNEYNENENDYNNNYKNDYNNNYDNNYNDNDDISNNNITEEPQNIPQIQSTYKEDERPIKPMKNNNFMNSENPFGLSKNGFPEDHINSNFNNYNNYNSQRTPINQKSKIKRNTTNNNKNKKNSNSNLQLTQNEEESKSQMQYQDNQDNMNNYNNNQYNQYDERPIGIKKIDYNAMFGEGKNFEGDGFGGMNQEINLTQNKPKIIKAKNTPRKKPVYDARKAIEEAKLREAKEGKKEKTSAFREFVKEMKKISAEEKSAQKNNNDNSPKISSSNTNKSSKTNIKMKTYGKDDLPIKKNNFMEDNNFNNSNSKYEEKEKEMQEQKNKRIPIKSRKVETKDMILRRKLHELERSPPPVLNIKGAKSKIECWGPSNEVKRQRLSQINNEKENKKMKNINKKNNYQTESKDSMNVNFLNKKTIENNQNKKEKVVDPKAIEEKAKKIALKKITKIENQINRIENEFNLDTYFKNKEQKMLEFGKIPYIKKEYNYVKKYSNEVYTSLVKHLMTQYQDLK